MSFPKIDTTPTTPANVPAAKPMAPQTIEQQQLAALLQEAAETRRALNSAARRIVGALFGVAATVAATAAAITPYEGVGFFALAGAAVGYLVALVMISGA